MKGHLLPGLPEICDVAQLPGGWAGEVCLLSGRSPEPGTQCRWPPRGACSWATLRGHPRTVSCAPTKVCFLGFTEAYLSVAPESFKTVICSKVSGKIVSEVV